MTRRGGGWVGYPAFLGVEIVQSSSANSGATIVSGTQLASVLDSHRPSDSVTIGWTDATRGAHSATVALIEGAAN